MSLKDNIMKNYAVMEKKLDKKSRELLQFYGKTAVKIDKEITDLFKKYEIDGKLTYAEMQKANRLKSFFRQISKEFEKLSGFTLRLTTDTASDAMQESYMRQAWALEQEARIKLSFTLIPKNAIKASVKAVNESGLNLITTIAKNRANSLLKIQEVIQQGLVRGSTLKEMRAKIKEFWDGDAYKADRVLRTETLRVREEGHKMATEDAREQGIEIDRVWLATLDDRTRDSHQKMDGQKTDKGDKFRLPSGEMVDGPHLTGIAEEDIQCRCTTIEVVNSVPATRRSREDGIIPYTTYKKWIESKDIAASQREKIAG